MTRVLSLIKPTGHVHLGNYLGALQFWASAQHQQDAFHGLADLHALTVPPDAEELRALSLETATILVAIGLDPDVCTLFLQSHVPEHVEVGWLMECTVSIGELRRMTQFKDKSAKGGEESARAGLFTYPALMAADILIYDANKVPVGDDQRQHLELTRDLAMRFNARYGDTFVVPEATIPKTGARIMDLQDPASKMGKTSESTAGTVYLLDDPEDIEKKLKRAVTDTETEVRFDSVNKPGVSNLLTIIAATSGSDPNEIAKRYDQYGPLKADAAEAVIELVRPIQQRYRELSSDPGEMQRLLAQGAEKAGAVASATRERAYKAVGLL